MHNLLTMIPKRLIKYVAYDDKNQPYVKIYLSFEKEYFKIYCDHPRRMASYLKMLERTNQLVKI